MLPHYTKAAVVLTGAVNNPPVIKGEVHTDGQLEWSAELTAVTHPADVTCLADKPTGAPSAFLFPRALEVSKASSAGGGSTVKVAVTAALRQGRFAFPDFDVDFDLSYESGDVRVRGRASNVRVPCVDGGVVAAAAESSLAVTNLAGSG